MQTFISAPLSKMTAQLDENGNVNYQLPMGEQSLALNPLLGKHLRLIFSGHIACKHCGKKTKKSYSQGYCFPCMQKLAQCDMCIMKPETCHFHLGTCREPEWGEANCFIPHYVYLANTSGLKVGITRQGQTPTRWIDQGATQALPIFKVQSRIQSGLVEVALAEFINDKTNWRAMLKGSNQPIDLVEQAQGLIDTISEKLASISVGLPSGSIERLTQDAIDINYPVLEYPTKVLSFNFDKTPVVEGVLMGIKGQYLIFDTGVINIRKFSSYFVHAECDPVFQYQPE